MLRRLVNVSSKCIGTINDGRTYLWNILIFLFCIGKREENVNEYAKKMQKWNQMDKSSC